MLKNKLKILAILFAIVLVINTICYAVDTTSEEITGVEGSEEAMELTEEDLAALLSGQDYHKNDLFALETNVVIDKLVDGNIFAMGKTVTVNEQIQIGGDMFVIAETVILKPDCYIYGNLFVIANNLYIEGVTCDVYGVAQNINLESTGYILRNANFTGKNITIAGRVDRHLSVGAEKIELSDTALIGGDFNYSTKDAIQVPENAVTGTINFTEGGDFIKNFKSTPVDYVVSLLSTVILALVVFALMTFVAPKFTEKTYALSKTKWLPSIGVGALTLVALPALALVLMITFVGVQVALAMLSVYFLLISLSFAVTSVVLANILVQKVKALESLAKFKNVFTVILVSIVLWAVAKIPYLGPLVSLLCLVYTLGLIVLAIKKEKKAKVVGTPTETNE